MERTESVVEGRTVPSPEVLERPVRRRFTVEYKASILAEADACTEPGRLGELLWSVLPDPYSRGTAFH